MEVLFIIFILLLWIFGPRLLVALAGEGARAVKKAVTGKETYFGPPELKIVHDTDEETGLSLKKIMFRGSLPNTRAMELTFALSAFDVTDGEGTWRPLFSFADVAQEPETICYQQTGELGQIEPGMAMTDWVQVGVLIPQFVQPPQSGVRKISILLRVFNSNDPPNIFAGRCARDDGEVIISRVVTFSQQFTDKGYEEAKQHREEAQGIALQLGVAVAMADGSLDDPEGEILKHWIIKEVSSYSGAEQSRLKEFYNDALRKGFADAGNGTLNLSSLVERLAEIGDKRAKYEAIELALDVMASDGEAHPDEMKMIRNVARSLDLDMDEIERMREGVTLDLSSNLETEQSIESLVGIEDDWSNEQKRKHLRLEFQKWSNRLNALPEGNERSGAQRMLDNIAALRKKYG